jgi:hypothetical protein
MMWRVRGWRSRGDGDARLDALLAGTWDAAAEAAGKVLDIQAGKEALLATRGRQQPSGPAPNTAPGVSSWNSPPPALKASRRPRKQRRTARALTVGGAVAALVAGALIAADVTGAFSSGSSQQIQTAAYITRVKHALAATQGEGGLVGYSRTVFPAGTVIEPVGIGSWGPAQPAPGAPSPHTDNVMVTWEYRDSFADVASTATGQPVYADHIAGTAHRVTAVGVSYRDATWWRATQTLTPGASVPAAGCSLPWPSGSRGWPAYIREELSCGVYHLDGRQRVGGIDAVKLTTENKSGRRVLWINPATYLPVRETDLAGRVPGQQPVQTDFRWFPVSAASLAHLKVSVPASFRQVQPPPAR